MTLLRCTTCKFTLSVTPEEVKAYADGLPAHCGAPMLLEDQTAEEPKKAKGLGKKKKKKG